MIDELHTEMINREIDGLNSEKESQKVTEFLSQNSDARALFRDLLEMRDLLARDVDVEPPPNLRKIILNSIQVRRRREVRPNFRKFSFAAGLSRTNVVYVFTLFAAFAVGVVSFSLFGKHAPDSFRNLYGTMAFHGVSQNLEISDKAALNLPGGDGNIVLKYSADKVLAELQLNTDEQVTVQLDYPERKLSFSSFGQSKDGAHGLSLNQSSVAVENVGRNSYILVFNRQTPAAVPLDVKVYRLQALVYEKTLSAGEEKPE